MYVFLFIASVTSHLDYFFLPSIFNSTFMKEVFLAELTISKDKPHLNVQPLNPVVMIYIYV